MKTKLHESITRDRVESMYLADDCSGICVACGEETSGVEPDAREYRCGVCGEPAVYGAEELLFMLPEEDR